MQIGELFMRLGWQVDQEGLKQFESKTAAVRTGLLRFTAATAAALFGLERFVNSSVRGAVALQNFTDQTGLSAQKLQDVQFAARMSNIALSADDVTSSIQNLQSNLTQIRLGGGNVAPFQLLGIDIFGQDAFQVLEQVRARIQGLDRPVAVNLIQQMGIDPKMINYLTLTRQELEGLQNQFNRSQEMSNSMVDVGRGVFLLTQRLLYLKDVLVFRLKPAWEGILGAINRVLDGFERIGTAISSINWNWQAFNDVLKASTPIILIAVRSIAKGISAMLWPFTLLFLLVEDFVTYMQGGQSVIGTWIDLIKKGFAAIADFVDEKLIAPIAKLVDMISPFFAAQGAASTTAGAISGTALATSPETRGLLELFKLSTSMRGDLFSSVSQGIGDLARGASNFYNNFYINSNSDAGSVARTVADELQEQFNYGEADFNNGVKY